MEMTSPGETPPVAPLAALVTPVMVGRGAVTLRVTLTVVVPVAGLVAAIGIVRRIPGLGGLSASRRVLMAFRGGTWTAAGYGASQVVSLNGQLAQLTSYSNSVSDATTWRVASTIVFERWLPTRNINVRLPSC